MLSIIMGSDSDLRVMNSCLEFLDKFEVEFEVSILSAHRTPGEVEKYAKTAEERGCKVIIAAAGGAAHLAGVVASMTNLPIIAVPINCNSLAGVDSLYSMVQMPQGIPVAVMGIDGAKNAAIFACQILALSNPEIKDKLFAYRKGMSDGVVSKNNKMKEKGYKNYFM